MSGIVGKKLGMTQIFDEEGHVVPVTVVKAGPCKIQLKKSLERDGYNAIQLDFEGKALREFSVSDAGPLQVGQVLTVGVFQVKDRVNVVGISKGRGFQGVIKRHGKAGGPASHGSRFHRTTGSIGQRTSPGEVFKNMKLPGHMGDERVTVRNLEIVGVRPSDDVLLIKGAVPGAKNGLLLIKNRMPGFEGRLVVDDKKEEEKKA